MVVGEIKILCLFLRIVLTVNIHFWYTNNITQGLNTWDARMIASLCRKRVKWLVRLKLPVSHFPGGTTSNAPPSDAYLLRLPIAYSKAFVLDVLPSPTPPKSVKTALCFRQLIAGYSRSSNLLLATLHSATLTPTDPNNKTVEITPTTCRKTRVYLKHHGKQMLDLAK